MDQKALAKKAEACISAGRMEDAADIYRQIVAQNPEDADTHHLLGLVYLEQKRLSEACASIQAAIDKNPHKAIFHHSLGDACLALGDLASARKAYEQALSLEPENTDTLLNLGNAIHAADDLKQALACYEKILTIVPDHPRALHNIGKTYYDQSDIDLSIKYYNRAIQQDANYAEAQFSKAVALLLKGDYAEGWPAYEWRFKRSNALRVYPHKLQGRRWDGSPYGGERLLVHCEQGQGDVLQFCRYLPMIKALGGKVILEAHPTLVPLLQTLPAVDEIVAFHPETPPTVPYDRYIPLLSLPLLMKTTLERIPAHIPYIEADSQKIALWRSRLADDGLRVGLVWAGSDVDPQRACRLSECRSWWSDRQIHFYSLQKGAATEQLSALGEDQSIIPLGDQLIDFSDTAALIANLDLVISVDTAAAHLAGAMGKPVWVLLPFIPDWRWLLGRSDTPWYPTARLFRQPQRGDWTRVIAEVDASLKKLTQRREDPIETDQGATAARKPTSTRNPQAQRHYEEGLQLLDAGNANPAAKSFQQAITSHPQWAEAHFDLGRAYQAQNLLSQAIDAYRTACRLAPDMKPAYSNLGLAYYQKGDLDQAAACYVHAIELHQDLAVVFNNLGVVREAQNNLDAAVDCYHCALRINPDYADALYNLGNIHLSRRDLDQALICYTQAVQFDPRHAKAHGNLGRTYHLMGLLDQANDCFKQALALKPDYPEVHLNQAVCKLLIGQWDQGWSEYEWRFQCHDRHRIYPHQLYGQRWQGENFKGRTLLVHSEQGIGDAIQFARYLPKVKERGGRVIFEARRSLRRLFETLQGADEVIELSADRPPSCHYHAYVPLGSLPGIFQSMPNTVPNDIPYLKADPATIEQWRKRLPDEGLNVGLVWGGNDTYKERSCTLADMVPLAFVKGINWVGLQKGSAAVQAQPEYLPYNFKVVNWGNEFEDFSDTAAAVECLDLVISIDTAVAHLAGALGKDVWILLPAVPDWRWLLERSQSPWYPTAHLFRQSRDRDWSRIIAHMSASLEQWRKNR